MTTPTKPVSGEGATEHVVIVHFDEDGQINYRVFGDERVRLFIVDDRAPNDRIYEWLSREAPAELRALIPEGADIGSSQDERHAAIAARINAMQDGRRHLAAVSSDGDAA